MLIHGQCHCQNLSFTLSTKRRETEITLRACDCTFCRLHAAKNWSDPTGNVDIQIKNPRFLQKYRFALQTVDFFLCQICGVYLGAILSIQDKMWSTVNFRLTKFSSLAASPIHYGKEEVEQRIIRRKKLWTPTIITIEKT